ncbi:MAG TPA: DUF169 domain-containing protein [Acidimicrobiia bacterium]|nr:DUF169 domain-containing protein [Acidimicrobiia bacterium]
MTHHAPAHTELVDLLGLAHAPVAITFHAERPAGGDWFDAPMTEPTDDGRSGRVPASCVFWASAHEATFLTAPEDHGNCSVGRFTHGLVGAADILDKQDVGTLLEVGWVTMEAFGGVAALDRTPAAIGYGPLAESAGDHDVVLLRVSPKQMMEIADSIEVEFSGKPQCQIIPRAAARNVVAASMGCALSRARIGMGDDEMTCAVPAGRVGELLEGLRRVSRADEAVVGYALADKARF